MLAAMEAPSAFRSLIWTEPVGWTPVQDALYHSSLCCIAVLLGLF